MMAILLRVMANEERDVTLRFLCCLYAKSRNNNDIRINGMEPRDIYDQLELEAVTREDIIAPRVRRLVETCVQNGYITPPDDIGRIRMTRFGEEFCYTGCSGIPICRD
jgi:hypothetical protein